MTPIQCGMLSLRTLTHLALVFGLVATGSLFLAIATDFWLYTTESLDPVIIPEIRPDFAGNPTALNRSEDGLPSAAVGPGAKPVPGGWGTLAAGDAAAGPGGDMTNHLIAKLHSGLWRSCVFSDEAGEDKHLSSSYHLTFIFLRL